MFERFAPNLFADGDAAPQEKTIVTICFPRLDYCFH